MFGNILGIVQICWNCLGGYLGVCLDNVGKCEEINEHPRKSHEMISRIGEETPNFSLTHPETSENSKTPRGIRF